MDIAYNTAIIAGAVITDTVISTSETTLLTLTNTLELAKSQLSVYLDVILGSATEVKIRYYVKPTTADIWYELPTKDLSSGTLVDLPTVLDSTSPTQSTRIRTVEDIPMSATFGLKVTGQAVTDSATLKALYVVARDN